MSGQQNVLSVFVDSSGFSTMNCNDIAAFQRLGEIQHQAWATLGKRLRDEFPSNMVLVDPINGVFEDEQERRTVAQCLHSRDGFSPDITERFREMVLDAYSHVLGTQATCIHVAAADDHPAAIFRR